MKYVALVLFLLLSACGKFESADNNSAFVDPGLRPYLEQYKDDKEIFLLTRQTQDIEIRFQSLNYADDSGIIGECWYGSSKVILIDPEFWFYTGEALRTVLFYHEMGHCDLNIQEHDDWQPGIMNSSIMSQYDFLANPRYFIERLFLEGK